MKFTIPQKELIAALKKVKPVVTLKSVVPCLTCGLIEAKGDTLSITGSNGDQRITVTTNATVKDEGATLIPFSRFFEMVDKMSGDIDISIDEKNQSFITSGNKKFRLFGLESSIYPPKSEVGKATCKIKDKDGTIASSLKKVKIAASFDATRYVLNGVHFKSYDGKLSFECTDGRRAHGVNSDLSADATAIVPTDAVNFIVDLFPSSCTLSFYENRIIAESEGLVYESKLIEGTYPNYRQVIPEKETPSMVFDRDEMIAAIKSVSATLDMDGKVKFESTKQGIAVSSTLHETGDSYVFIECKQKHERSFVLQGSFLSDALAQFDEDEISIENKDASSPVTIREGNFAVVIMPMRTAATAK